MDRFQPNQPQKEMFSFGKWTVIAVKSHILTSEGPERERFEKELQLPQCPEMIFADNLLRLCHSSGVGIEFNVLDALRRVDSEHDHIKVAVADEWRKSRSEECSEILKEVFKPYDWTYSTDYKGTLFGEDGRHMEVSPTSKRIDMDKLKKKEKILFYEDIILFEDELADNGCSILRVKIRVMPSGFFILLRLYIRVDEVLVRLCETRLYHEAENNYVIREFTRKERPVRDLQVPSSIITDANEIGQYLQLQEEILEKLTFSSTDSDQDAICR